MLWLTHYVLSCSCVPIEKKKKQPRNNTYKRTKHQTLHRHTKCRPICSCCSLSSSWSSTILLETMEKTILIDQDFTTGHFPLKASCCSSEDSKKMHVSYTCYFVSYFVLFSLWVLLTYLHAINTENWQIAHCVFIYMDRKESTMWI